MTHPEQITLKKKVRGKEVIMTHPEQITLKKPILRVMKVEIR